jgi:hypothetical protein
MSVMISSFFVGLDWVCLVKIVKKPGASGCTDIEDPTHVGTKRNEREES